MIVGRHERCLYNMSFFMPCGGQWGSRQQGLAGSRTMDDPVTHDE